MRKPMDVERFEPLGSQPENCTKTTRPFCQAESTTGLAPWEIEEELHMNVMTTGATRVLISNHRSTVQNTHGYLFLQLDA